MKIPVRLVLLSLAFVSIFPLRVFSQAPAPAADAEAAQVEVANVKFNAARFGGDSWFETEIDLNVKPGGRAGPGFVDRVRVILSLGVEATDDKGGKRLVFHRANVEAVTLEGGKSTFRFYLPPEVVRRDKLRPDVKFYTVELEVGGQPVPLLKGSSFSNDITTPEMLRNFLSKVSAESGQNEGVLIPQHLSPFASDSQRRAPSVFRREGQR